jgi:YidC/Oxa1 family membrane protein insertase
MKFKEMLLPLSLALLTTWVFQYFFFSKEPAQDSGEKSSSGQRFVAPKKPEILVNKPLNVEIDFLDAKATRKSVTTELETEHALYEFSNDGAIISRLEFRRNWGGKQGFLSTIFQPTVFQKERGTFLIAFDEKTPFYFDLIGNVEQEDCFILSYKAHFDGGELVKKFTVYKKMYRLDMELLFTLDQGARVTPRIFFASPLMPELTREDVVTGIVNDERNKIKVFPKNEETAHSYWSNPTLFGTQDRYFVHAMVDDYNHFCQRAYYKLVELDSMYSILEGPEVKESTSWSLTFYMGPKEDDAMAVVDSRLEQTLNYGWFGFISKPLSKLLLNILNFLKGYVKSYGLAIIILTILIKLLMLPFTFRAEEKLKKSSQFQKKLEHIQSKYKNDPQALAEARAELVKKHGMPGLGGCLPLLLQLPVFWALSIVLSNSIELYKVPFLWVRDLSAPDPYYIFPIVISIGTIFSSRAADPKQRISMVIMGLVIGVLLSNFSAGLTLYIAVSTLLSVIQSFIAKRLNL